MWQFENLKMEGMKQLRCFTALFTSNKTGFHFQIFKLPHFQIKKGAVINYCAFLIWNILLI